MACLLAKSALLFLKFAVQKVLKNIKKYQLSYTENTQ
jgi:hypothetical protein